MKRDFSLWLKLFIFRFFVALCTISIGHPDELWQFNEPAHAVVFNRGHLTWDWRARIRSFVFPLPLIAAFYVAKLFGRLGLEGLEDFIVQVAPLVIRAFWASTTDLYTVKLSRKFFGPLSTKWALLFTLSNMAQAEIGTRAYSNAVETSLCSVVAYIWPTNRREWSQRKWISALTVLGLACLIRISAVQMFLPAACFVFLYAPNPLEVIFSAVPLMVLIFAFGVVVDSYFYGEFTVSWWNFFQWNVVKNISSFFGVSPFYYYFNTLTWELLKTVLPFTVFGLFKAFVNWKSVFPFFLLVLPYFIFCSLQPHKEHRFILPILPLLLAYSAHGGQQLEFWLQKKHRYLKYFAKLLLIAMVVFNSADIADKLSLKFIGHWNAIQDLRKRVKALKTTKTKSDSSDGILLLTNCHNFPHYGVFHYDYPLSFVSCTPHFAMKYFINDPDFALQVKLASYFYSDKPYEALKGFIEDSLKPPAFVAIAAYHYLARKDDIDALGYEQCSRHKSFLFQNIRGKYLTYNDVFILCRK